MEPSRGPEAGIGERVWSTPLRRAAQGARPARRLNGAAWLSWSESDAGVKTFAGSQGLCSASPTDPRGRRRGTRRRPGIAGVHIHDRSNSRIRLAVDAEQSKEAGEPGFAASAR